MKNMLLNVIVILLYFCYHNIIFYLGNGHMVYMGTAYKHQGDSAWSNVGLCQLMLMNAYDAISLHEIFR